MSKQLKVFFTFCILVLPLSWIAFFNNSQNIANPLELFLMILGLFSPTIAAVIVSRIFYGKGSIKKLFAKIIAKSELKWIFLPILFQLVVFIVAFFIYAFVYGFIATVPKLFTVSVLLTIPGTFALCFIENIWEELGWRGFLLEKINERYPLYIATILVGGLWAVWHLPLILTPASAMSQFNLFIWIPAVLLETVIYSYIYVRSKQSVMAVTFLHVFGNTFANLSLSAGLGAGEFMYYIFGIKAIVAIFILVRNGTIFFVQKEKHKE